MTRTFTGLPFSTSEKITLEETINQGKYHLLKVTSSQENSSYALKLFPKTSMDLIQYKKELLMNNLTHPNIIRTIPIEFDHPDFYGHFTEFAKYGDFHSLLSMGVFKNNETIARTYFHQLLQGVEHLHSQGIAHLDLKLENLVLGSDFLLKIIDFDQSQLVSDKLMTSAGTPVYRAPEVFDQSYKNLSAVDVYSLGIILYILKTGEIPFLDLTETGDDESLFTYIGFCKQNQKFWENKAQTFGKKTQLSQDFIELINGMLHYDSKKRLTLEEIKNSKWFKGATSTSKKIGLRMSAFLARSRLQD